MQENKINTVGEFVVMLRRVRGCTQIELADKLAHVVGLSQPELSALENNNRSLDAGQMEHLLNALQATEDSARRLRKLASERVLR